MKLSHADMAVILGHLKQAGLELEPCYKALAALAQQETDVTKIAGWCALCEEPNGCPHGHSEEEWIAANHRMIAQRRGALAQQAQPGTIGPAPDSRMDYCKANDLCYMCLKYGDRRAAALPGWITEPTCGSDHK